LGTVGPVTVVSLPDQDWVDAVGEVPGIDAVPWDLRSEPARPDQIELVVPSYLGPPELLARLAGLPSLRAVQLLTAGYETAQPYLPQGVQLANAAGVHDASTAELAVTLMLASLRGIPDFVRGQERSHWGSRALGPSLADRRVLLVGYGGIGQAVARRLQGFEVAICAVASSPRDGDHLVQRVHGIDELGDLLPDHDVVVLAVPLTDATKGMVDGPFLAAMKHGALLVNVSRGKVVDTDALVRAAAEGRVAAALDVTDPEPLPPGHPLWTTPGVLVSPHVGGATSAFRPRALALLRDQLRAFGAGEPLRNIVT